MSDTESKRKRQDDQDDQVDNGRPNKRTKQASEENTVQIPSIAHYKKCEDGRFHFCEQHRDNLIMLEYKMVKNQQTNAPEFQLISGIEACNMPEPPTVGQFNKGSNADEVKDMVDHTVFYLREAH